LILLNGLSERLVPHRRLVQAALLEHLANGAARAFEQAETTAADDEAAALPPGARAHAVATA
jgi:ubiquinone biosynthesis protein